VSIQRDTGSLVTDVTASRPDVLASDADREAVGGLLSSAFAEGRLTAAEHAERVRAAYGARTVSQLSGLTADLPAAAGSGDGGDATVIRDGLNRCLLCALLICCPPAGIAWLLAGRRRARASGGGSAPDR